MSSEQSFQTKTIQDEAIIFDKQKIVGKIGNRVDINNLISKLRAKEKLQRKENLFFFGLVGSIILVIGIISFL